LASGSRRILTALKLRLSFTGYFTHIFCLSIKSTIRPHHTYYRLNIMQTGHRTGCKGRGSPSSVSTKSSGRQNMLGKVRMTALAVAVTLACSGLALANDRDKDKDDYNRNNAQAQKHRRDKDRDDRNGWKNQNNNRNQGWQRGDGDRDDRGSGNWRNRNGQNNSSIYQNNQGSHRNDGDADDGVYNRGGVYNGGSVYNPGGVYNRGSVYNPGGVYYPGNSGVYNRGTYPTDQTGYPQGAFGGNPGFRYGYSDGAKMANADMSQRKPFNPEPRGKYNDRNGGYQSVDGDKNAYKAQYSDGYRAGYQATFGRY
jgi:hypothetical protein